MGQIKRLSGSPDRELDTTPIEMPLGGRRPPSLADQIARMVHSAIQAERNTEVPTWDEEDDFDEEDPDILDFSKYELQSLHEETSLRDYGPEPDAEFGAVSVGNEKTGDQPDPKAEEPS